LLLAVVVAAALPHPKPVVVEAVAGLFLIRLRCLLGPIQLLSVVVEREVWWVQTQLGFRLPH
jgi:hypothetical protein